uniref:AlNc14C111G6399 protein n=1 Tax=Albugo laibachii Nc14 TaxID=890382 RepID=F0WIJ9_9STRA|nr:AlNc14C111G6399 [Albugo laibachii Nc14]|eukprot:CCA21081.1 AlNc14C111G6399 [Albugo laibachii Nc14]
MNKIRNAHVVDKLDEVLEQVDGMGKENAKINGEQLYYVNILVAMRWAQEAWGAVAQATVANCCRHTGILGDDIFELVADMHKLHIGAFCIPCQNEYFLDPNLVATNENGACISV